MPLPVEQHTQILHKHILKKHKEKKTLMPLDQQNPNF